MTELQSFNFPFCCPVTFPKFRKFSKVRLAKVKRKMKNWTSSPGNLSFDCTQCRRDKNNNNFKKFRLWNSKVQNFWFCQRMENFWKKAKAFHENFLFRKKINFQLKTPWKIDILKPLTNFSHLYLLIDWLSAISAQTMPFSLIWSDHPSPFQNIINRRISSFYLWYMTSISVVSEHLTIFNPHNKPVR